MLELFFSYSHRDEPLRNELEVHLAMLKRQGVITTWDDRRIGAGKDFGNEISDSLDRADIVLLLVSPYFLASDYCYDVEMRRALERHHAGATRVIPVILQACDWHRAPFGALRASPNDGKPISKFPNQHDAFLLVAQDIRAAVEEINASRLPKVASSAAAPPDGPTPAVGVRGKPRSSNLRLRREYSDHERARFILDTFEYLAAFFEASLAELQSRAPGITTEYRRIDADRFTASIYRSGHHVGSCTIRISEEDSRGSSSEIRFSFGAFGSSSGNSFNESMSVTEDGYMLGLRTLGMQWQMEHNAMLTPEGAAECYWDLLIAPLR